MTKFEPTTSVREAAAAAGYRTPTQFVKVWQEQGYPILRPSPRKRSVFVADLQQFLDKHIQRKDIPSCHKTSPTWATNSSTAKIAATTGAIEATIGQKLDHKPEKTGLFERSRDQELTDKLAKVHEGHGQEDAVIAAKDVPSAKVDSFDAAFEQTYEFLNSSEADKASRRDAAKLVATVKENAARFGVTLSDQDALAAAMKLEEQQAAEAASEHAPVVDDMRAVFRDATPAERSRFFRQTAEAFRQDPIGTLVQDCSCGAAHVRTVVGHVSGTVAGHDRLATENQTYWEPGWMF
jgi:hypothetical protein